MIFLFGRGVPNETKGMINLKCNTCTSLHYPTIDTMGNKKMKPVTHKDFVSLIGVEKYLHTW